MSNIIPPAANQKSQRFEALDSLRGIAALIVVFFHTSLMIPESFYTQRPLWVSFIPWRFLFNGYAAVIIFFILSGYVLSTIFLSGKERQPYLSYLTKRICRIYIPFVFSILISVLLYSYSSPTVEELGWWGDRPDLTLGLVLKHLLMTGVEDEMWLNGVMWSLVEELRISIIFPLLIILCLRPKTAIFVSGLLYVGAVAVMIAVGSDWSLTVSNGFFDSFLITIRYTPFFIIGILLMKYNDPIQNCLGKLTRTQYLMLFLFALLIFCLPKEIHNHKILAMLSMEKNASLTKFFIEILYGIAGGFIVVSVRRAGDKKTLLNCTPVKWLGSISYSLYLLHAPIILFLFRLLLGEMPIFWVCFIAIIASVIAAHIFFVVIERPSIIVGKYLSNIMKKPSNLNYKLNSGHNV